jgi:hypothetical protein
MEIRKAQRRRAKMRVGIAAPSGAGKTYSALLIAFGLSAGGKVGVIDTERGSAELYEDLGEFDVIELGPPYSPERYVQAIREFEKAGYTTIIIDSLSHAWAGEGGSLDKQGKLADRGTNNFAAWRQVTPGHNALVEAMLQSPCHVIATMRSKTEYVLETDSRGRQVPKKVGMAPVMRDGIEYEFTVMFEIDAHHVAQATKDRTRLFDGQLFTPGIDTGDKMLGWLNSATAEPAPSTAPRFNEDGVELMSPAQLAELRKLADREAIDRICGAYRVQNLDELPARFFRSIQRRLSGLPPVNGAEHQGAMQ